MVRMIKLLVIAALVAAVAAPAFARTVRSKARGGIIGAGPRQDEPVLPGTSTIPGRVFPSMAQKSLSSASGH